MCKPADLRLRIKFLFLFSSSQVFLTGLLGLQDSPSPQDPYSRRELGLQAEDSYGDSHQTSLLSPQNPKFSTGQHLLYLGRGVITSFPARANTTCCLVPSVKISHTLSGELRGGGRLGRVWNGGHCVSTAIYLCLWPRLAWRLGQRRSLPRPDPTSSLCDIT